MSNFVESPEKFAGFIFSVELRVSPLGCVYVCVCKYCTCVHLLSCHISTIRHGSTHTRRTFQKRFIGTYTVWKIKEFYSQPFFDQNSVKMNLEEKSWCGLISRNIWEWMRILSFSTTLRIHTSQCGNLTIFLLDTFLTWNYLVMNCGQRNGRKAYLGNFKWLKFDSLEFLQILRNLLTDSENVKIDFT